MIRKLLLLVATNVAMAIVMASPALADTDAVHVEGGEHIVVEGEDMAIVQHTTMGEEDVLRCEVEFEGSISESGAVHLTEILFHADPEHPTTQQCAVFGPCNGEEWEGQIEENEAGEGYLVQATFCLENSGLPAVPITIECAIDNNAVHCDVPLPLPTYEIEGETFFHDPIDINHL